MIRFAAVVSVDVDTFLMVWLNRFELMEFDDGGKPMVFLYHDSKVVERQPPAATILLTDEECEAFKAMEKEVRLDFIFKNKERITAN